MQKKTFILKLTKKIYIFILKYKIQKNNLDCFIYKN